ncbi:MAG TPA: hypothetical protein VFA75_07185 [Nevskia sp.]|nr:hypothetical protein [Nevskia sp.]
MNMKLNEPVRELDLVCGYFSEAYMLQFFPDGIGTKQKAFPKREQAANANPYDAHRQHHQQGVAA